MAELEMRKLMQEDELQHVNEQEMPEEAVSRRLRHVRKAYRRISVHHVGAQAMREKQHRGAGYSELATTDGGQSRVTEIVWRKFWRGPTGE